MPGPVTSPVPDPDSSGAPAGPGTPNPGSCAGATPDRGSTLDARHRVVVVDLGFLGDTLHTIPALWVLREHHPHGELHVVTTPVGAEVLRLVPCVDRVWIHPLGKPSPPWWRHLGLIRELRRQRWDLSLNFSGADRTLFLAAALGARRRITRELRPFRLWQRLLAGTRVPPPSRLLPVYEQRRQVLVAAGYAPGPVRFGLRPSEPDLDWARHRVPDGAIHLSISASHPLKEWPLTSWAALANRLFADGVPNVIATGSGQPRERERLQHLRALVPSAKLEVIEDTLPIPRLAALLAQCQLHLGTDSGVTHLAFALGLPTVTLFREYAGLQEWRPHGPRHTTLTAPCRCVDQPVPDPACAASHCALCLAGIPVDAVALHVAHLLAGGLAPRDEM